MSDTLIKVEHLHKKFCQSLKRSMWYGTVDAAKSMIGLPINNVDLRNKEFWALQDINFELKRGEVLGLIGPNGCGKTTLLRMINGIFPPDKGRITINGRIGALIAVGAGFHPHMSGRENIFLNATILGMTKDYIKHKLDEIIDFAEIGDFIDAPVATYSSGMNIRLGFAIAINCEPDILLIDEILAVGDAAFRVKCFNKIYEIMKSAAIVFVSHSTPQISRICDRVILLKKGQIIEHSENIGEVIFKYNQMGLVKSEKSIQTNGKSIINSFKIANENNEIINSITTGDKVKLITIFKVLEHTNIVKILITVSNEDSTNVIQLQKHIELNLFSYKDREIQTELIVNELPLNPGNYKFTISILLGNKGELTYVLRDGYDLSVIGPNVGYAPLLLSSKANNILLN